MKILLTRPGDRNQGMIDALKQRDIGYWVTPLLDISACNSPPSVEFYKADKVIFISANAVEFAAKQLNNHFPSQCQYFCVGEATKLDLAQYGISSNSAPQLQQDSEGLLTLPQLQSSEVDQQAISIIRGEGGRETLADTLITRGAKVSYWQVYKRQTPQFDPELVCQQWRTFGIDTLVVTSGESLTNLVELVPKELFAWLQSCHIIVPSSRIQTLANRLGLHKISNANGASTQAVLTALAFSNS
jgi:uroporphyrinogen-III synthase